MAANDLPYPPGFEDLDPAEIEDFRSFLRGGSGSSSATGARRGSGLTGEQEATVEVKPWAGDVQNDDDTNLIDTEASFEAMGLCEALIKGIYETGFVKPSKIQAAALPHICLRQDGRLGKNMIGQAQNGSGKTATFCLGLLSAVKPDDPWPQALVVCPTRELARQNEQVISQLGQFLNVKTLLVVPQAERIAKNAQVHVLIGTPGKIQDLSKKRILDLSGIKVFVLDEADLMLDQENQMGPQVSQIRRCLPEDIQVLFFSATYPDEVRDFAEKLVPRAYSIKVKKTELTVSAVTQLYMKATDEWDKFEKLQGLYEAMNVGQSVVFVNQRKKAFQLAKWMKDAGFAVSLICGTQVSGEEKMDPQVRDQVMDEFRTGITKVLIATDVLSRGIDVPQVTLVVNYELPMNYSDKSVDMETYLHRVGRTGRFGFRGIAVNLVTDEERTKISDVCSFFACKIDEMESDYELLAEKLKCLRSF